MKDKQNQFNAQEQHSQAGFNGSVYLSRLVEERTYLLVRLLGYGLLVFALIDYIDIVIPPRFTDPLWEFQTIGALVEHVLAPLLGLILVFYRHEGYMGNLERNILRFLSWVSLLVGLLYLLMLPLGLADTWRIYHSINVQIAAQLSQQSQQLQQIKAQLNQVTTDEQLKQLLASLPPQGRSLEIKNPQASKDQFLAEISQAEHSIKVQADSARTNQRQGLIKNSVKWNLGGLVAGTLFIWIWRLTDWARNA